MCDIIVKTDKYLTVSGLSIEGDIQYLTVSVLNNQPINHILYNLIYSITQRGVLLRCVY